MGIGSLAIYIYYYRKGQFDDLEDIKYQMFRTEKDENVSEKKDIDMP